MSFESDTPDFSLIVGTLGRTEPLRLFLDSLREQPDCTFEVILIDQSAQGLPDGFTDGCGFSVRVFRRSPGLSACRNFGLQHAVGRFVAFPDDDCEYPSGLLGSIRAEFLREPALGGISTLVTDRAGRFSAGGYMASAPCRMTPGNIWRTACRTVSRMAAGSRCACSAVPRGCRRAEISACSTPSGASWRSRTTTANTRPVCSVPFAPNSSADPTSAAFPRS